LGPAIFVGLATIWRGLEGLSAPRPSANRHCSTQGRIPSWRQRVLPPNARFLVQSYSPVGAKEYSHQIHGFLFSRIRQLALKNTPAKYTVSCSVVFVSWRQRVLPPNTWFLVQSYSPVGAKEYSHQIHCFLFSRIRQLAPKNTPAKCTVSCSVVFASWRQRVLLPNTRFLVQSYSSVGAKEYSRQIHGFLFSRIRQLAPKSTPIKYTVSCSVVFVSWRQRVLPPNARFLVQLYSSVGTKEHSRQVHGFLDPVSSLRPNDISIGLAVLHSAARRVPNTPRQTEHETCDVRSNRPHLCATHAMRSNTAFALYSRLYNRLRELCK